MSELAIAYLAGLGTVPAIAAIVYVVGSVAYSIRGWRRGEDCRYAVHECLTWYPDSGRWGRVRHPHTWPDVTPWWLIGLVEPLRRRRCYRSGEYKPLPEVADA